MSENNIESSCYICLGKETKRNPFHNTQCGCTGSIKIHKKCYEELILSRGNSECCVCKRKITEICPHSGLQLLYVPVNDSVVAKYTVNSQNQKHGVYYEIDKSTGNTRKMMEFIGGLRHGETTVWRPDGSIYVQGNWVLGARHGEWIEYEEDPMLGYTITLYSHGSLVEYYRYNYDEELVEHQRYDLPHMLELAKELDNAMFGSVINVI